MAIKRTSSNSISNAVKLSTGFASAAIPNSPTIGTATATSDVAATVEYTAAVLGATGSTFIATSNPGSVTGTGSSPITVTGLTASTAYTFTVTAGNANGTSAASSASNSITTNAPSTAFESIATYVLSTSTSSVTFSSIPQTYKHLQIRVMTRDDRGTTLNNQHLQLNGVGTTDYSNATIFSTGSGSMNVYRDVSQQKTDYIYEPANNMTPNLFGTTIYDILDYSSTTKNKTIKYLGGYSNNGAGHLSWNVSGLFLTTAVSSLTFTNSGTTQFVPYSHFALYGIKG